MANLSIGLATEILTERDGDYHDGYGVAVDIVGNENSLLITLEDLNTNDQRAFRFVGEEV